jgi:DtxR family Mn-dependent transcriptional regulator
LQVLHFMARDGVPMIAVRLAERVHVTPPTVAATLQRMVRDGLVTYGPRKEILLTERGRELAETSVRRHALTERLLTDFLKMPWHEAHEEAHGLEHAMTPKVEERLMEALGHPTTCPHGNPIPGWGRLAAEEFPLDRAESGDEVILQRITEEAEEDLELMRYLQQHGVAPGARLRVREAARYSGLVVLEGERGTVSLSFAVAAKLRAVAVVGGGDGMGPADAKQPRG